MALAACSPADDAEDAATPEAEAARRSGPEEVVDAYYTAISNRDYDTAWQLWGKDPLARPEEFTNFVDGFKDTELAIAEIGQPGQPRVVGDYTFVQIPVRVEDLKSDGTGSTYVGSYTLRRISSDDESWQILRGDLH